MGSAEVYYEVSNAMLAAKPYPASPTVQEIANPPMQVIGNNEVGSFLVRLIKSHGDTLKEAPSKRNHIGTMLCNRETPLYRNAISVDADLI